MGCQQILFEISENARGYLPNVSITVNKWMKEKSGVIIYEGESNENLKYFFTCDLLNKSGTQVYHFST
jgi:hypothetical protein